MYRSPAEIHDHINGIEKPPVQESQAEIQHTPAVHDLMGVVIQTQDQPKAVDALEALGITVIILPSTGAFLSRRNVTLLLGIPAGAESAALEAIQANCHERIEYIATPVEGASLPLPLATPVTVGGATIFRIHVERYVTF